jgi:hypothetical protein
MASDKSAVIVEAPVTKNELLDALKLIIDSRANAGLTESSIEKLVGKLDGRENRSNPNYPKHSAFSYPEGDRAKPRPTLARETWHNNARVREDQCTPEEILAFNALSASLPNPNDERSSREGRWIAKVNRNGTKLMIVIPCRTIEDRDDANSSTVLMFCRELAEGKGAITPQSMAADIEQLKADRDRLEKLLASNGITLPIAAPA